MKTNKYFAVLAIALLVLSCAAHAEPVRDEYENVIISVLLTKDDQPIKSMSVTQTNGYPVSLFSTNEKTYLKEVNPAQGTVTTDTLKTGISMTLKPEIQADDRIKMDISISLLDLNGNSKLQKTLLLEEDKPITEPIGVYAAQISVKRTH